MGFRNPITTAEDPTARSEAAQAQTTANNALSVANGKSTTYVSATAPAAPAGGFVVNDEWLDTTHGQLNVWTGSAWSPQQWGSAALSAGSVVAGTVAAGAIDGMTITGATVQTGSGSTPAVRVYQAANPDGTGVAKGVLDFSDGVSGDSPARLVQQVNVNPKSLTEPFGRLSILGGSYDVAGTLTAAPELDLTIDQDASGNPLSRFLVNAPIVYNAQGRAYQISGSSFGAGWSQFTSGTETLTFLLLPDGTVQVEGLATWTPTATGASSSITTLGGAYLPVGSSPILPAVANDDGKAYSWWINSSGVMQLRGPALPAAGWVAFSGSYRAANAANH